MSANQKALIKTRITDEAQIQVGKLVAYVSGPGSKPGTVALTRGFIRSIDGVRARIGNAYVKIDKDVIRYILTTK
jgi:hypothetical protein